MAHNFCKKSVFCILFLFFFAIGTICGVFLCQMVLIAAPDWMFCYCAALAKSDTAGGVRRFFFLLWPFLAVFAVGLTPMRRKLIPIAVALRGCLLAYCCTALYMSGSLSFFFIVLNALLMPIYFILCAFLFCHMFADC